MNARVERVRTALTFEAAYGGETLSGRGRWRAGPCPLHGGRSPRNLRVDVETLRWTCHSRQCHGAGASADVFAFLAYRHGLAPAGQPLAGDVFRAVLELAERLAGLVPGGPPPPPAPVVRRPERPRETDRRPAALWARCVPADGTPAGLYMCVGRQLWPPSRPLPAAIRWAPRDALRAVRLTPPAGCAGAVAYAFTLGGGAVAAVQIDGLTKAGEHPGERWRRTLGPQAGTAFRLKGAAGEGGVLALCEGPLTAVALALRGDVGAAWALGGTSGLRQVEVSGWRGPVRVHADADGAGRAAAVAAWARLGSEGVEVVLAEREGMDGGDAADALAARVRELRDARLAADEKPGDALAGAWSDVERELRVG